MAPVTVRYIVDDVDAAIAFYTQRLGFSVELHPAPGFAIVSRGDLRLLLNVPTGSRGSGPAHARWSQARARWLEPHPTPGRRPRERSREAAQGGSPLPQRHRRRHGRKADPARRPAGNPIELF